ncbi:MAG: YicC family protein [Clostridia bacterium]|nr:YicC family protein [Clostridia bacterium]
MGKNIVGSTVAMYSMTGYGRGEYKQGGLEVTAEIKTVNNRYLDMSVKCPRIFSASEEIIRGLVREKLTRGHADVYISVTDKREKQKSLYIDMAVAKAYVDGAKAIAAAFPELKDDFTVTALMRQSDVIKQEETGAADEEIISAMKTALSAALDGLNAMREVEGKKLADDMLSRVNTIAQIVNKISERAPLVAEDYKKKLEEKIRLYTESVNPDEGRLLTEVAVFADKSNIDEELTRLNSHIAQFGEIAKERLVGRKLDFLVQEFNRESNTVCSKSNDVIITKLGLQLKNEIEKIREQVQNVE